MENIGIFFEKYKNFGLENKTIKETLIFVIKNITKVELDSKQIILGKQDIKIKVSGASKSQLLINAQKIKKDFERILEEKGVKNFKKIGKN